MANGISRYPSGSTAWARAGSGLLNAYLTWRNEQLTQRQMDQQNQMTLQRDQAQRDFQTQQQQAGYQQRNDEYARNRDDTTKDRERAFLRDLVVATANQGTVTPELLQELKDGGDLDEQTLALVERISAGALSEKEAKARASSSTSKEIKPVDMSLVRGDAIATFGEDIDDEVSRNIGNRMQRDSIPFIYAATAEYPDPTKVPRKNKNGGLGDEAKTLRDFEATRPEVVKNLAAAGVPIMSVVDRIVAGKEDPDDAARHATADHYAKQIVSAMQIDPNAPISMEAINSVLRQAKLEAIPGAGQRTLPDLVDEMIARNVGANGKKPQLETIMAIIQQAMSPQQPQQQGSALGRGIMNTMADIIPGIQRSDFKQKGTGMAGAVKPRAQGFDRP